MTKQEIDLMLWQTAEALAYYEQRGKINYVRYPRPRKKT